MKSETITYAAGSQRFAGVLVHDEAAGRRPAILMSPNWLGVTPAAVERAKLLAGFGYTVFIADMYGENRRPNGFAEAPSFAEPLRADAPEARRRIRAAYDAMVKEGGARGLITDKHAAVGFCFGGGNVLEFARDSADVAAVVAIHPDLTTALAAKPGAVKANLLAVIGAPDPVVPKAHRDAFEEEMNAAGAKWQMLVLSGLLHAYTDVGLDVPGVAKYDEPGARQSYRLMNAFITDAFAGKL